MDKINEFHKANIVWSDVATEVTGRRWHCPVKRIVCNDGFSVSVQASETDYCSPRETGAHPYWAFELGYPSERDESLMQYAEDEDRPTNTVYGYVPVSVVEALIDKHGGIAFPASGAEEAR